MRIGASGAATVSGAGPSDPALVVAARAGELWAKEALFRRYATRVNGLALRLVGRGADADDLVQESFIQAFANLDSLRVDVAFVGWLSAIVCRTAHKMIRTRRLLNRLGLRAREPIDVDSLVSRAAPAPDVVTEVRAIYSRVVEWPPKVRIAFLLRRVEGASIDEIADWTGSSPATVKRRLVEAERLLGPVQLVRGDS